MLSFLISRLASSDRRANFKKGIDSATSRRRRNDTIVKLRKDKKEESLQKRRAMASTQVPQSTSEATQSSGTDTVSNANGAKQTYDVSHIPMLMQTIRKAGVSQEEVLTTVRGFRKILSVEHEPPVEAVLQCGIMPILVQLLSASGDKKSEDIQFESAWALTNVASTNHTRTVVEYGALSPLIQMLMSGNADVRDQSIWCLGNIAGDCPELRDIVITNGALPAL